MGDDAKARMREFFLEKPARRRETRRCLNNAHRRETQKHFSDARPALTIMTYFKQKNSDLRWVVCVLFCLLGPLGLKFGRNG